MHITIEHIDGKYPSFNVALSSKEGTQPFLVVKGCRIVDGQNGQFVSGPATKNQTSGKYWNHTYFSEPFAAAVLDKALGNDSPAPAQKTFKSASQDAFKARQLPKHKQDFDVMSDEPPF
jgi:DNA-binding cell septation regulator SpoVG